ncbi:MAG: putative KamA family protein, partial [Chlamydiota bacterium]
MPPLVPSIWRAIQRANFTRLPELLRYLELDEAPFLARPKFPLNLPRRLAAKIQKGVLNDPILLQFLPLQEEVAVDPFCISDPVDDASFRKAPKLLHKYTDRALLLVTSACAMHCRYCFRQNFDYDTDPSTYA